MVTKVLTALRESEFPGVIAEASDALRNGKVVVFPTETVYGVGANATDADAIDRLRTSKGRDSRQPFTVHVSRPGDARQYVRNPSSVGRRLARRGWPGPLTIIFEEPAPEKADIAATCSPEQLSALYSDGTIGLRCPAHPICAALLAGAATPVVASSANPTGSPPPMDGQAALRAMDGRVDLLIDAGPTQYQNASTVVRLRGQGWEMVREGALDSRTIEKWARSSVLFVCTGNTCRSPLAEHIFRAALARELGLNADGLRASGYIVSSAGTFAAPGGPISRGSLNELARREIDASSHTTRPVTVEMLHAADRIYVMSPEHASALVDLLPAVRARVSLLDERESIGDPIGGSPDDYRRTADQIERAAEARLREYLNEDRDW